VLLLHTQFCPTGDVSISFPACAHHYFSSSPAIEKDKKIVWPCQQQQLFPFFHQTLQNRPPLRFCTHLSSSHWGCYFLIKLSFCQRKKRFLPRNAATNAQQLQLLVQIDCLFLDSCSVLCLLRLCLKNVETKISRKDYFFSSK